MGNLGGFVLGIVVATLGWFITGFLDLSWVAEIFSNLF